MALRTLVIIQARVNSTRLPRKVLRTINGLPMIYHVIRRVQQLGFPIVVATPDDPGGPEDDVLTRFCRVAQAHPTVTRFIRITGDCPLWDLSIGRQVIDSWHPKYAYVGTAPEWDGLDTEIFTRDVLFQANSAIPQEGREHVTRWMCQNRPASIRPCSTTYRWSVDDLSGLEFVRSVYAACPFCANGVEHHTNAFDSIGGSVRTPIWDLHRLPHGGLEECRAYGILKTRMGGLVYVSP